MSLISRLKAAVGLGPIVRAAGPRDPKLIVSQLPLSWQLQRIGGSLTPQQIAWIIQEADSGFMFRLMDLANEARQKDCHLQCVLGTRENALAGLDWSCTVPKGSRLKDRKAAEWMDEALRQAIAPIGLSDEIIGFNDLIASLTGAAYYGFSNAETVVQKLDGRLTPVGWSKIAQRRFVFDQATGRLMWCDQGMAYPGIDLMATYPGRFIQHRPRINGDVPCREGLVRVLMWAALFRNWDIRDWMSLAELAWKPWRTGKYQKDSASTEDIDNLAAILDGMTANGVAVHPDSTEINIEWPRSPPAQNSNHAELANFMGAEMSKAVLGQTLTTDQGSKGSQALGRVHNEVRKDILEYDARSVASTLRRHLIAPLIRMNFGSDVMIPDFRFLTEDATELESFSKAIYNFKTAGLKMSAPWVRDKAGMPEPEEDEELLGAVEVDTSGLDDPKPAEPAADGAAVGEDPAEEGDAATAG